MAQQFHILLVDDDPVTRVMLSSYFEGEGYRVSEAEDGARMDRIMRESDVDLIMLDINLPGEDGLSLTKRLRAQSEVGIILVTARTDDVDRIVGLELGADDYVTKPFNTRELLARAKNLLRKNKALREALRRASGAEDKVRQFSGFTMDLAGRRLSAPDGNVVRLTRGEFEVLATFVRNPGRVLSRDNLLDSVSRQELVVSDRTIDVFVGRLRRKIERNPKEPEIIVTVHGVGYVLGVPVN